MVPILTGNSPLICPVFLKRPLVFAILLFSSSSLHCSLKKIFLYLLAVFVLYFAHLCMKCSLIFPIFLKRSLVFPILLFSSYFFALFIYRRLSYFSLLFCGTLRSVGFIFPLLLRLSLLFSSQLSVRPPQTTTLPSCISLSLGWFWSPPPVQCYESPSTVLWALCLPDLML